MARRMARAHRPRRRGGLARGRTEGDMSDTCGVPTLDVNLRTGKIRPFTARQVEDVLDQALAMQIELAALRAEVSAATARAERAEAERDNAVRNCVGAAEDALAAERGRV